MLKGNKNSSSSNTEPGLCALGESGTCIHRQAILSLSIAQILMASDYDHHKGLAVNAQYSNIIEVYSKLRDRNDEIRSLATVGIQYAGIPSVVRKKGSTIT